VILTATSNGLTPVLLLVSVFVTFRGHNAPGGGFAGGLIMSAAIVLRYLADGPRALTGLRIDPMVLVGTGLLIALTTAVVPLLAGEPLLESAIWKFDVPLVGEVKLVTSAFFDVGVHILVLGVITAIVLAFVRADAEADTPVDPSDVGSTAVAGPAAGEATP
jgi:multicomponent Na+:H+ antiporter subunit A